MPLQKTEIRMGDVVALRNGETIVVYGVSDWYEDQDGHHDGPWVMVKPEGQRFERYLVADVVRVVTPNPRSCKFCGEGVTSTDPDTEFCRNCFYSGRSQEEQHEPMLDLFREKLPEARYIGIEHTGGGCFWLAVYGPEGSPFYWAVTDGEASIPDFVAGEGWGIVCRYAEEEHAQEFEVDGTSYDEYNGVPILYGADDPDGWFSPTLGHDAVIEAIRADMKDVLAPTPDRTAALLRLKHVERGEGA